MDYLGAQGYWVCTLVAVVTFVFSAAIGHAIAGMFFLLFYYLGGVGVRERSRYAAVVLSLFVVDALISGLNVVRVLLAALLLSNLRATWIASSWKPGAEEGILPPRLAETWSDKFADKFPAWLWPKVRVPYHVFSAGVLLFTSAGWMMLLRRAL